MAITLWPLLSTSTDMYLEVIEVQACSNRLRGILPDSLLVGVLLLAQQRGGLHAGERSNVGIDDIEARAELGAHRRRNGAES